LRVPARTITRDMTSPRLAAVMGQGRRRRPKLIGQAA
jgi:hypothetical protein